MFLRFSTVGKFARPAWRTSLAGNILLLRYCLVLAMTSFNDVSTVDGSSDYVARQTSVIGNRHLYFLELLPVNCLDVEVM